MLSSMLTLLLGEAYIIVDYIPVIILKRNHRDMKGRNSFRIIINARNIVSVMSNFQVWTTST